MFAAKYKSRRFYGSWNKVRFIISIVSTHTRWKYDEKEFAVCMLAEIHFILPSHRRMQTNIVSECKSNTICRANRSNGNAFLSFLFFALPICSSKRYTLFPRSKDQNYVNSAFDTASSLRPWCEITYESVTASNVAEVDKQPFIKKLDL